MKKDKKRRLCAAGMAWLLLLGGALLLSGCNAPEDEEIPTDGGGTGGGGEGAGGGGTGGGLGGGGVSVITLAGSGDPGNADGIGEAAQFKSPYGVAVDSTGNVYVADLINYRIRKITPGGTVSTLAGTTQGYADGTGTAAKFGSPYGVAVDSAGTVYVADSSNHRIRKITPGGTVSTLAGSGTAGGFAEGSGTAAKFKSPFGVAVDSAGTVYVADSSNHRIRKITPGDAGTVSTLAGSGDPGNADGPGTAAQFYQPYGVAVDSAGTVYVADIDNHRIRKITPEGEVTTLAGSGNPGYAEGSGTAAQFSSPRGVAVDSAGTVYVADSLNHRIRKITPDGTVSTLAGSTQGFADGTGTAAQFNNPTGVAVNSAGTVYVADMGTNRIRKITQ
jgi:sugar lactone lactonase YvrE